MRKFVAVLLAILMVVSMCMLTACKNTENESKNESESESASGDKNETTSGDENESTTGDENESTTGDENESGDDPILPTLPEGPIRVTGSFGMSAEDGDGEVTVVVEFDPADSTCYVSVSYMETDHDESGTYVFYYDGRYIYGKATGNDNGSFAMTPEALLQLLAVEMGIEIPSIPEDAPEDVIAEIPEEYLVILQDIMDMLPEMPEEEDSDADLDLDLDLDLDMDTDILMDLIFSKINLTVVPGEDGSVTYTADLKELLNAVADLLDMVDQLLKQTPADLINTVGGEGAYDMLLAQLKESINGETTVRDLVNMMADALNEGGFRITEEKLTKLLHDISALEGSETDLSTVYLMIKDLPLDTFLPMIDPDLSMNVIYAMFNTFMTANSIYDLMDQMFGEETSTAVSGTISGLSGVLRTTVKSLVLSATIGADGKLSAGLTADIADLSISCALTVESIERVTVPESLPELGNLSVDWNEDGDLVFTGVPAGATVVPEAVGYWQTGFGYSEIFWEDESEEGDFSDEDLSAYITVSGDTVTVSGDIFNLPETVMNHQGGSYDYTLIISVKLADGTNVLVSELCVYHDEGYISAEDPILFTEKKTA